MDFKNSNGLWKLKRFCKTCMELILNQFCLSEFYFQFEFLYDSDFQVCKTNLKRFILKFCLLEIMVPPYTSLITKLQVHNVFDF